MGWKIFVDDDARTPGMESFRYPPDATWFVACSAKEAIELVQYNGLPVAMDLDHDLGDSTVMEFLRKIEEMFPTSPPPRYSVHSRNPAGAASIHAFMRSWKVSRE